MNKKIFIIGVGRSGTTLIQAMLNSHPKVNFIPEIHFIRRYLGNIEILKRVNNKNQVVETFINKDNYLSRIKNFKSNYIEIDNINSLVKIHENILNNYSNEFVGEKDPKYLEYLRIIKYLYPDSIIIHIVRDPRDVVLSRLKAKWSQNRGIFIHSLTYNFQYKKAKKEGRELFDKNYYEVNYEKLITSPENELKRITEFLKISYDEKMLSFYKKAYEIIKGKEKEWKKECFEPLNKTNKNKWKMNFKINEILLIEHICKDCIEDSIYEFSEYYLNQGIIKKIKYTVFYYISNIFNKIYNLFHNCKDYRIMRFYKRKS